MTPTPSIRNDTGSPCGTRSARTLAPQLETSSTVQTQPPVAQLSSAGQSVFHRLFGEARSLSARRSTRTLLVALLIMTSPRSRRRVLASRSLLLPLDGRD